MKKISQIINFTALGIMLVLLVLDILVQFDAINIKQAVYGTVLMFAIMLIVAAVIFIFNFVTYKLAKYKLEDVKEYKLIYFNLGYALFLVLGLIITNM